MDGEADRADETAGFYFSALPRVPLGLAWIQREPDRESTRISDQVFGHLGVSRTGTNAGRHTSQADTETTRTGALSSYAGAIRIFLQCAAHSGLGLVGTKRLSIPDAARHRRAPLHRNWCGSARAPSTYGDNINPRMDASAWSKMATSALRHLSCRDTISGAFLAHTNRKE